MVVSFMCFLYMFFLSKRLKRNRLFLFIIVLLNAHQWIIIELNSLNHSYQSITIMCNIRVFLKTKDYAELAHPIFRNVHFSQWWVKNLRSLWCLCPWQMCIQFIYVNPLFVVLLLSDDVFHEISHQQRQFRIYITAIYTLFKVNLMNWLILKPKFEMRVAYYL